jgi:SET domain-containing protein 6
MPQVLPQTSRTVLALERRAVAIIPKSAILSIRSSYIEPYTRHLRALSGPKATLALTFVLHAELLKGSQSSWWGYLQSLPDPPPSLPIFWSSNTQANADALQAASWAAGTEIWKELHADIHHSTTYVRLIVRAYTYISVPCLQEDICSYYHSEANGWMKGSSILRDHPYLAQSTLAGFCNAYALVSSRSFIVDVYHGLAMVPIADA